MRSTEALKRRSPSDFPITSGKMNCSEEWPNLALQQLKPFYSALLFHVLVEQHKAFEGIPSCIFCLLIAFSSALLKIESLRQPSYLVPMMKLFLDAQVFTQRLKVMVTG